MACLSSSSTLQPEFVGKVQYMADSEHLSWLLEGVDAWNRRRQESDFMPDLSNIDLRKEFQEVGLLENNFWIPLRNVNLSGARLVNTSLKQAMLIDADLRGTRLCVADLTGSHLDGAKLQGADLTAAILDRADLMHAELVDVDFTRTRPWKALLYENTEKIPRPPLADLDPEVKSVSDLMKVRTQLKGHYNRDTRVPTNVLQIKELVQGGPDIPDIQFYFRGISQCLPLEPSVMRGLQIEGRDYRYPEADLLIDLISRRPEEFEGERSALGQMVLARHYGLKTRLLDISRNPLAALFHTCLGDDRLYGMLHVFAVPKTMVKSFNSDRISIIANFARLTNAEQDLLLGFRKEEGLGSGESTDGLDYESTMRRLYHFIRQEKPYFEKRIDFRDLLRVFVVEPRQSFPRIRAQSGAFLISAFHRTFERLKVRDWNEHIPIYDHYPLKISPESKKVILDELSFLNVTSETLYPGLEKSAEAVNQAAKEVIRRRVEAHRQN